MSEIVNSSDINGQEMSENQETSKSLSPTIHEMMLFMRVTLHFQWDAIGMAVLEGGALHLPPAPSVPGIYKFNIGQTVYVGETDHLPRRFQQYRTPGISQSTNVRLKARMMEHLALDGDVAVAIIQSGRIHIDGRACPTNFSFKSTRLFFESAAVEVARADGLTLENH
jgi:hypothetical protein